MTISHGPEDQGIMPNRPRRFDRFVNKLVVRFVAFGAWSDLRSIDPDSLTMHLLSPTGISDGGLLGKLPWLYLTLPRNHL